MKRKTLLPIYLKGLIEGKYTLKQASESTGYSVRWLSHLKTEYKIKGLEILDHHGKNHIPINKISQDKKNKIIGIYAKLYKDVNFRYFHEALQEYHEIKISLPSLRNIMNEYGIKSPEARHCKKKNKPIHRPRIRRENFGDLLQIDGTPFDWFYKFGNNKRYCIVGSIDDATSKITGLYMTENECLYGYLEILRQTCTNYGIPREIYSDRAAIFCVTPRNKKNLTVWEELEGVHDKRTQWQRILDELGINQILAWSPEAKGRVERMWSTLQGRLPQEFYMNQIDTIEKANLFLPKFITKFNSQFSVEPKCSETFFIPISLRKLDDILSAQFIRVTDNCGQFSFHGYKFAIVGCDKIRQVRITICLSEKGMLARINGEYYNTKLIDKHLQYTVSDNLPEVVRNIIHRYMYTYAKEFSV